MRYLLLVHLDEAGFRKLSAEENERLVGECAAFGEELQKEGIMVAADRLRPTATARTVRVRNGQALTTDGPFAETKEQLGGFYMIDVNTFEEALQWAARVPPAKYGSIEVRPVWDRSTWLSEEP
jgi:hypothetical protein